MSAIRRMFKHKPSRLNLVAAATEIETTLSLENELEVVPTLKRAASFCSPSPSVSTFADRDVSTTNHVVVSVTPPTPMSPSAQEEMRGRTTDRPAKNMKRSRTAPDLRREVMNYCAQVAYAQTGVVTHDVETLRAHQAKFARAQAAAKLEGAPKPEPSKIPRYRPRTSSNASISSVSSASSSSGSSVSSATSLSSGGELKRPSIGKLSPHKKLPRKSSVGFPVSPSSTTVAASPVNVGADQRPAGYARAVRPRASSGLGSAPDEGLLTVSMQNLSDSADAAGDASLSGEQSASPPPLEDLLPPHIETLWALNKRSTEFPRSFEERVALPDSLMLTYDKVLAIASHGRQIHVNGQEEYIWAWIELWVMIMNDVLHCLYDRACNKEDTFTNWIQQKADITRTRAMIDPSVRDHKETTKELMKFLERTLRYAKEDYVKATDRALDQRKRCEVAYRMLMYKMGNPELRRQETETFSPRNPFGNWPSKLVRVEY